MSTADQPRRTAHTSEGPNFDGPAPYHHGRSPAAWCGSLCTLVAFIVAGIGTLLGPNWTLIIIAGALVVVGLIATRALQVAGFGNSSRER